MVAAAELSLAVVKRGASYLSPGRKSHLLRLAAEVHGLPKYLVGAVLASDFDADRIFPRLYKFSFVVLAVPLERVFSRRASGAGDGSQAVVFLPPALPRLTPG